jgi:hypothetical protein
MDAASTRSWLCEFRFRVGCYEASDAALEDKRLVMLEQSVRLAFPNLPYRQHVTVASRRRRRFASAPLRSTARLELRKKERAPRGLGAHTRLRQV